MLSMFSYTFCPFGYLLWRNVCLYFQLDLLLLRCVSCLYILEIKPLLIASFADIFSYSIGCLLFKGFSLLCKRLQVWLGQICLFLFLFLLPWETDLRKHFYIWCQRMFCLCSLLGVWWCLALVMFESSSHFEFIFVSGVRKC